MTTKEILEKYKELQTRILSFIEKDDDLEENFHNLKQIIEEQNICNNSYNFTLLLHLIAKIADNHYHETDFNPKIEKIILLFKEKIKEKCQDSEIFCIFKNNKKILLFSFENNKNNFIASQMQSGKYKKRKYPQYFFPEIMPYIKSPKEDKMFYPKVKSIDGLLHLGRSFRGNDDKKDDDNWISEFSSKLPDNFYEDRNIGENGNEICELIRKDLIDNFITYVEHENYPLLSTIPPSDYETNPFLLKKTKTTLIEYAVFHRSNQIFEYLLKKGVVLTPSLWEYAVHSNNLEFIHFLEEKDVKSESYIKMFNEAIKCHHNEIAIYIMNNYLDKEKVNNDEKVSLSSLKSYNFAFLHENQVSFSNLCKYDCCPFVEQLIKQENINVNELIEKEISLGPNRTFTETKSLLHTAIEKGNVNIVKLLLTNENLDVNMKEKYVTEGPPAPDTRSLFDNSEKGYEWAPWDEWDRHGRLLFAEITPLYLAIVNGNIDIIKTLLESKNADINLLSKFSIDDNCILVSPLHAAVANENLEIVQLLLNNKSIDANAICIESHNNPDGKGKRIKRRERTPLLIAVDNERVETVKLLISSEKVDPNLPQIFFEYHDQCEDRSSYIDEKERHPLHIAIHKNNIEMAKLLLNSERIDLNFPQIELKSEILVNESYEKWEERRAPNENPTVENSYLWSDIPKKWISTLDENKNEKSPLYLAIELNNNKMVQLLLENEKIDVNMRNKLVTTNISRKDKINKNKVEEKTALNLAIENENIDVVFLLLKNDKINIDFTSKLSIKHKEFDGDENDEEEKAQNAQSEEREITPLQIATEKGNEQIIELIKNYKK